MDRLFKYMIKQIDAVYILVMLFIACSVAQYFKIPVDQTLLATILVALNIRNSNGPTLPPPTAPPVHPPSV